MGLTVPALDRTHLRPGDRVCAAVSGGADSVAMLVLLHASNALPRNALGVGLSAVHVHHGLRGVEADGDQVFVEEICGRLGVPLHVRRTSVPERVERTRAAGRAETVEEAARAVRYGVFRDLLELGAADSIATAHTLDDQAETVLMKLLRGAWTEGLSGVHPVVAADDLRNTGSGLERTSGAGVRRELSGVATGGKIVRPLLGVRHAELCNYLGASGQEWREDESNLDEVFTRNRVRHRLLPVLREFNPEIDGALANLAVLAREEEARWTTELGRLLPQLLLPGRPVRGGGRAVGTGLGEPASVSIELERLRGLDAAMRRRVLRAAARSLGVRLSFDETARLLELGGFGEGKGGGSGEHGRHPAASRLQLSGGLRAERTARELQLYRAGRTSA